MGGGIGGGGVLGGAVLWGTTVPNFCTSDVRVLPLSRSTPASESTTIFSFSKQ